MKFQGKRPPSIALIAVAAFESNYSGARFRRIGRLSFLYALSYTPTYLQAQHVYKNDLGDSQNILAGYYKYDMVRTAAGWKIKKYSLTITWATGNGAVWELAAARVKRAKG